MKNAILSLFILSASFAKGQADSSLITALRTNSMNAFNHCLAKQQTTYSYYREIVNNYYEAEYNIGDYNPAIRILLIYHDTTIITYTFTVVWSRADANGDYFSEQNELSYENPKALARLKTEFKNTFGNELNDDELFQPELLGESVGLDGTPSEGEAHLLTLISTNKREEIVRMLSSARLETQLYGVKGLRMFQKKGIRLSEDEQKMINVIIHKKGLVQHASGCIMTFIDVATIVELYELDK